MYSLKKLKSNSCHIDFLSDLNLDLDGILCPDDSALEEKNNELGVGLSIST